MTVEFLPGLDGASCFTQMCSESQVFSIGDFDTNYCNLRNVYCNVADGCELSDGIDLEYEETFVECSNPLLPSADSCFAVMSPGISEQGHDGDDSSSHKSHGAFIAAFSIPVGLVIFGGVVSAIHRRRKQAAAHSTSDKVP